ncbi:uridine kinase [Kribbella pittospori]|uniref:Uridine kinase n=1 Tax=Kribbella pittospori TaxID=722689 RepID=A0A4V2M985_9ACTN|nr:uridine kinase [Kribbella pittospori]TCC54432.1 uridine kinase [Kribbella pittospori]
MRRQDVLTHLVELIVNVTQAHPVRVAVDGPDTAGKTTLADELAVALSGVRPTIRATVDDYIRPTVQPAGYFDDNFDLAALTTELLIPLGPDGDRHYRTADGTTGTAPPNAVLLVDGVFLLQSALRPYWDFTIYLHIDEPEMLRRGILRDQAQDGGPDAVRHQFETQYIPGWRTYQAQHNPTTAATITINNQDPTHPEIREHTTCPRLTRRGRRMGERPAVPIG